MPKPGLEIKNLDKLLKMLKDETKPVIRVGILGGDASKVHESEDGGKTKNPLTNAEIGAIHEYGSMHNPVRSFLRVPLTKNLNKELQSSGLFDKAEFKEVIETGDITPWLQKIQMLAEGVVQDAFDTGGDGTWIESDMRRKKVHQTLVETQQLRNSITSEIKRKGS